MKWVLANHYIFQILGSEVVRLSVETSVKMRGPRIILLDAKIHLASYPLTVVNIQ